MFTHFNEVTDYLYSAVTSFQMKGSGAYKPGLENIEQLLHYNNNPHLQNIPFIHVAGTNGKGSVTHLIASSLAQAGYKTGLYTSPHLIDFRERIKIINLRPDTNTWTTISQKDVIAFMNHNEQLLQQIHPSFFEITTAMALSFFAKNKTEVAVIETGLGGRLDSTNILKPVLTVITNIGYDHTDLLGTTLPQIAFEKAGIMKQNVPCIIGEYNIETAPVFESRAHSLHIPLFYADQATDDDSVPSCALKGCYQRKNEQTAFLALQTLQQANILHCSAQHIKNGFLNVISNTGLKGRWETLSTSPLIICDIGHNGHAWQLLTKQIDETFRQQQKIHPHCSLHLIFGMVSDKDVDNVLSMLPSNARIYFTQSHSARSVAAQQLKQKYLHWHNRPASLYVFDTVEKAVKAALDNTLPEDVIFIGGSTYVVGESMQFLQTRLTSF